MLPDGRFTILPLTIMVVYLITAPLVRIEILRARVAQQIAPQNGGPASPVGNSEVTEKPPSVS